MHALLARIEAGSEAAALAVARELDGFTGEVAVGPAEIAAAEAALDPAMRAAIVFAHDNIRRFAQAQRATLTDMQIEIVPGVLAGQKAIPVAAAGCYVPGGRFSHIASALMTITTARAAGVARVVAVSPPRPEAASFAPETGPEAASFAPETGPEAASFAPETGPAAASFAPETGPEAASFAPETGPAAASFAPETGPEAASFAPETGPEAASFAPETGPDGRIAPDMLFAMHHAGADTILTLGGVQGIAAMAFGLFGLPRADILVGPGNAYVAEAKRQLFGRVGIDMVAGPTNSMILADATAAAETVAADLVGQMEHGADSPVWLVTTEAALAEAVMAAVPRQVEALPAANAASARAAWAIAAVILADTREEMAAVANRTAPEHLHVQAADLDWWLGHLTAYGSLFLGAETTVAFGDKAAGPNHVLPTSGAARYTGGLSVHTFLKTVTWQRATAEGARPSPRRRR